MRSVIARWVEAEVIRRKQMGVSFHAIAEQLTQIGRGEAEPLVAFPPGLVFPPDYRINENACGRAFRNGFARLPNLEAEEMRKLDTERCEDIYRGLATGIMRGEPGSGAVAIRALAHKATINGYAAPAKIEVSGPAGGAIEIEDTTAPLSEEERKERALEIAKLLRDVGALPPDKS